MSLRIGVDLDGTVADLSSMYHTVEARLFGEPSEGTVDESPEESSKPDVPADKPTDKERLKQAREASRRNKQVWRAIQETPDFWTTLAPIEDDAVRHLNDTAKARGWEVFFITQRPTSVGAPVQWQSQQWLAAQGFEHPSVLTLRGDRGRAAHALELDFLIDDLPRNCVDVIADSKCRPLLVLRSHDEAAEAAAVRLKIGVVRSVRQAVDRLAVQVPKKHDTTVGRVLKVLGLSDRR